MFKRILQSAKRQAAVQAYSFKVSNLSLDINYDVIYNNGNQEHREHHDLRECFPEIEKLKAQREAGLFYYNLDLGCSQGVETLEVMENKYFPTEITKMSFSSHNGRQIVNYKDEDDNVTLDEAIDAIKSRAVKFPRLAP